MNANLDSASSASSGAPAPNPRASRGQIAAQACETCRSRKQKCDEQRPKCSLCNRMNLECRYRVPQPTKKDKTLVDMLDRLTKIEGHLARLPTYERPSLLPGQPSGFGPAQPSPSSQPSFSADTEAGTYSASSYRPSSSGTSGRSQSYRHSSAAHKILIWPAMQSFIQEAQSGDDRNLALLEREGLAFLVHVQQGTGMSSLPLDDALQNRPFVGMQLQSTRATGGARITFPSLTRDRMVRLAGAYFDTFNLLYPFMDRQNFLSDTLSKVDSEGFNGDTDSVIALLVFALGEVSIEGSRGQPVDSYGGRPSGIRGGTNLKPPGLALFNEARKRIGFVITDCDLEHVQIFSLAALFYGASSRHLDFWRMTITASSACRVLVTCMPVAWESSRGDLIKRMYWHCAIMETCLYLELDLPLTGILDLADQVGLPTFKAPFCEADHRGNQYSHFKAYYASQVDLRRLCANLHSSLREPQSSAEVSTDSGPTATTLNQLALTLAQWRESLPIHLQWSGEDPTSQPPPSQISDSTFSRNIDPQFTTLAAPLRFSYDLNTVVEPIAYVYDIQVALLRTRYCYAKYMVLRPFVYKALHFPKQMTREDARGVAECLRSCVNWPLVLAPTSRRKRLIPYLFSWSQIFMSILLIIEMTRQDDMLAEIRSQLGQQFENQIHGTVDMMIDWIRDLRNSDPIARWCYRVIQPIYRLDPFEDD